MAERDRFELDLAAALRAYLEDAPTEVRPAELARQFATAYPHRRVALGRWRFELTPALAWLLVLAGLLLALVGGALLVGSQLQRRLPAILPPIGQVYACPPGSTPDEPGPVGQAGPPEAEMGVAFGTAFDRRAGRLVAVTSASGVVETWTFDVCTNTWTQMHPNREPPGFGWAELVYDIDSDVTILVSNDPDPSVAGANLWAYDLQADTWTEKGVAPTMAVVWVAYDPVSGLVVAAEKYSYSGPSRSDRKPMWTYDLETDTWTPIRQALEPATGDTVFAYDTSVDRMVVYTYNAVTGEPETWLFDIRTGTWSRSSAQTPVVVRGLGPPNIAYDEAAKRTVITSWAAAAYDASANRWEMLMTYQGTSSGKMAYDPVNERLVGPGPYYNGEGVHLGRSPVFAFDPGTHEWTVLLEPGGQQSAPATMPASTSARTTTPSGGPEETGLRSPGSTASPGSTP